MARSSSLPPDGHDAVLDRNGEPVGVDEEVLGQDVVADIVLDILVRLAEHAEYVGSGEDPGEMPVPRSRPAAA
jgi:hypothetical protein